MLKYTVSLAMVLATLWLLFSGLWTHPIILPLGLVSVLLTVYLAARMKILDREGDALRQLGPALRYWPWLLVEITKSNLAVARCILTGKRSLSPRIARVATSQKTEMGLTLFANSITLTPGTVTIHVRDNEIWFYALTAEIERDLVEGEMDRRVTQFEGEK